jgi:hypothetical protein
MVAGATRTPTYHYVLDDSYTVMMGDTRWSGEVPPGDPGDTSEQRASASGPRHAEK